MNKKFIYIFFLHNIYFQNKHFETETVHYQMTSVTNPKLLNTA